MTQSVTDIRGCYTKHVQKCKGDTMKERVSISIEARILQESASAESAGLGAVITLLQVAEQYVKNAECSASDES